MSEQPNTAAATAQFLEVLCHSTGDTTMPVQQILLLLALHTYGEMSQHTLGTHTGVQRSSNSRNIAKLGTGESPSKPGLGLVESYEDLADRRNKMVRLTPKGSALLRSVVEKTSYNRDKSHVLPE